MAIAPIQVGVVLKAGQTESIKGQIEGIKPVITISKINGDAAIKNFKAGIESSLKSIGGAPLQNILKGLNFKDVFKGLDMKAFANALKASESQVKKMHAGQEAAFKSMETAQKAMDKVFLKANTKYPTASFMKGARSEYEAITAMMSSLNKMGGHASMSELANASKYADAFIASLQKGIALEEQLAAGAKKVAEAQVTATKGTESAASKMSAKQVASLKAVNDAASKLSSAYKSATAKVTDTNELSAISARYRNLIATVEELRRAGGKLDTNKAGSVEAAIQREIQSVRAASKAYEEKARAARSAEQSAIRSAEKEAKVQKQLAETISRAQKYYSNNSKLKGTVLGSQFEALIRQLNGLTGKSGVGNKLTELQTRLAGLQTVASARGLTGKSWLEKLNQTFTTFAGWSLMTMSIMKAVHAVKDMFNNVKNLDDAMVRLKRVTDYSDDTYSRFFEKATDRAKKYGTTLTDTIDATANTSRLGLDLEQATNMADAAMVYMHVGDGIENIDQATNSLTSTIQAFRDLGYTANDSMMVVDKINDVGNKFAITQGGIGDALQRSASALAAGNNNLDESIGLITAANTIVQNPESVGTMLKTVSMYLRAAKAEAEDAGESTDGMASSVSKLRESVMSLTGGKVDIQLDEDTFKSTYQIFKEISEAWDSMTDIDQAALLEMLGGKRNANAVSAMIKNFDIAERAMNTSAESTGSALKENEKYLDSISGKLNVFRSEWETFSSTMISSDFVKGTVGFGSGLLETLTAVTEKMGSLPLLISSIAAAFTIKSNIKGNYASMFSVLGIDSQTGKVSAGNSPLVAFGRELKAANSQFTNTTDKMVMTAGKTKTALTNSFSNWWTGADNEANYTKSFNKLESLYDDFNHKRRVADRGWGKGIETAEKEAKVLQKQITAQEELMANRSEAAKEYIAQEKAAGRVPTAQGFAAHLEKTTKNVDKLGARAKLASAGVTALNTATSMAMTMGIAAAFQVAIGAGEKLYESIVVTKEEMANATQNAQSYQDAVSNISNMKSQVSQAWNVISNSSSTSADRIAAYEQLRSVQADLIKQYGGMVDGQIDLTSSSEAATASMEKLAAAEGKMFNANNYEEIYKAQNEMNKTRSFTAGIGWFKEDAAGANDVLNSVKEIADKYEEVSLSMSEDGEYQFVISADATSAQGVISDVQGDIDNLIDYYASRGIDAKKALAGLSGSNMFANALSQISDLRSQYGDVYDASIQSSISMHEEYGKAVGDLTEIQNKLSEAMVGTYDDPTVKLNAMKEAMEGLNDLTVESLLGDMYGKNASVDKYFDNWITQIQDSAKKADLEVSLSDWLNIDTGKGSDVSEGIASVKKEIETTFKDMDLGALKELYAQSETGKFDGTAIGDGFKRIKAAADDYNISVTQLLDTLYDYDIISGNVLDKQYVAAEELSKVVSAFSSGNIFSGMAAAMKAQSEGGGTLSYDSYEALIASSAEYAKAVDFENGYMRLNVGLAKKLSDEKAKLALASINEQKANDEERYKANARAIEELIEKGDDLSNSRIRDLQAENDQITANIQKYNAYASTLKQISSGYYAFTQVSEADNSDVEFGKAGEAKKVIEEALNSGKTGVGNVQYQMALDFIIPDDVQQKGEKAVSDYMSTINRYMADEKQGMSNFLADMVTAGVATQEDGKIKLNADMTMDKFLEAFANAGGKIKPITEDVVDSMFGVINMYTDDEFKLVDPKDISNIMQAVSDFQKAQAEYKSAIGDENIAKKKEELSTYAEALKDIPEEQLTELGIKFVDGEGHAVSPDEIANAVNSGTTINVDENANHLINDLKKLSDLKNDIKIETDTSKVSELASDIENITDRINKTASEKFGFDAEITSVQGLADAYATVSENLEMYKSKRSLFEQKGLNTSELDTKISELESQKVELNAYMKLQGMDEVHAKISELKKNIEDTKAEIEHGAKVGANTEEAEQKLAAYERQLNAIGNTEVGAKVSSGDLDALYTQAEGVWQKIQEITKGDHTVKLSASEQGNVDELYSQLEELQQLINESGGELNIDFSFKGEEENGLVSVITEVAGEEYNLNLKVDQQALRDQVFSAFEGFDGLLDLPEQELPVEPIVEDDVEVPINPIVEGGSEAIKRAIDIISGDSEAEVGFTPTIKEGAESALDKIKEQFDAANVKVPVEYTPTNGDIGDFIGDQSPVEIPAEPKLTKSPEALGGEIKQIDVPIQPTIDNIRIAGSLSVGDIKAKINAMFAGFHPEVSVKAKVASEGNPNLSAIDAVKNAASKIANTAVKLQIDSNAPSVLGNLNSIASKKLPNKSFTVTEYHNIVTTGGGGNTHRWGVPAADGTKNAPGGRTLVGELGPELVVSNGQFYIAGQIGAEFVDLNKGDIVFNHKDTERILKGEPGARGRALSSGSISLDKLTGTSSSSSSSKSGSYSSSTAKALTSKASKSTENMDKKLEKLIKELSETLDNFDSAIKASLAEGGDIDAIIQTYRDALAAIEAQKEAYRKKGVKEDSKYMNDLKAQWYEYRDKMASSIKEYYDRLIDTQENFSKLREKSIENMLHSNDQSKIYEYMNDRLEAITKQQDLLHEQAERLREAGFLDTDKEVAELSLKWWDLQEDKIKAQVDIYDALIDRLEATNTLFERMRDNTTKDKNRDNTLDNDRNSAIIATNEMLKNLKFQREAIEEKLAAYSAMGYSQSSKEVLELKEEWYKVSDAVEDAREQIVDTLNEMASNTSELIEEVKNVFDVFHKAAEDYADNNGFISVDSYRDILELGPQYMQMLKDENGVLVINKEKIDGVIKALTEKAAVESALSYLEQVKIAYMFGETEMLDKLIYSTATTTEGTWGLVYANAALLKVLGLSDEQYEQLMWNLKAYQSIANNVKDGVSVVGSKDLDELKNGAEDLLDYVMDMIKHEIEEQVKALQKMKDDYTDIIKLKKESLEITKKESDYQEEIADKLKEASKIQAQINALSLDDSREAIARRKELEESLAELQKDIAKDQADYALDRQKDMLDDSQDAYEKQKDEEIETLENTISSKEKLYRLAIERIETHWETIYSELIEWNTEYGNSLNKEITSTWELAKEAVNMYGYNFEEVISKMEARIKELKGELSDLGDTATNLIVGDLDGSNTSFLNEEAIKAIVSMMEQNSATWITDADGSHVSNQKLADELRKYGLDPYFNSRTGEWYTDSSMNKRLYDSYGDGFNSFNVGSVESNAAVIKMLVNKMKSNSAAWAGSSNEQRTKLSKQNIDIAKTLRSYGIDVGTSTDKSGAWIIKSDRLNPGNVGRRLYDVYHKGGIVGDAGTIKQNEMIAKLEKGEAVLDKKKESGVMRLLDFASSVADRVGSMMNNSSIGHMDLAVAGAFGSLQPVQAYTVNFGDTYITGTSDENISAHKKITRDFTNEVLKQLNIKR